MKCTALLLVTALIAAVPLFSEVAPPADPDRSHPVQPAESPRDVDLVICLDTSGSMDGLIESAKQKLWAIVNDLAQARPRPRLRVALYQYGNDGLNPENGWVQQLCPLSDDLDAVYEKLFELKTNGGTEFVSRVVRAATNDLDWSTDRRALKMIVVAGNEAATQDNQFPLKDTCQAAIAKGIIVNTIFCGKEQQGRDTGWADAAGWADGRYAAIDQNGGTVAIATPYDDQLAKLGGELNSTYVAYGAKGKLRAERQVEQDANAVTAGAPVAAQRATAKASALYRNAGWDLVDAVEEDKVDLADVDAEQLPEPMRQMNPEQRKQYVQAQAKRRRELQKQIAELAAKRETYRKQQLEQKGLDESSSFDAQLRETIRDQGRAKGFSFAK